MTLAVIPSDAIAGVVGVVAVAVVWLFRLLWKQNERVARLEERMHHVEEAKR